MSRVVQCGRCKSSFHMDGNTIVRLVLIKTRIPMIEDSYYELCNECATMLLEFMENKSEE